MKNKKTRYSLKDICEVVDNLKAQILYQADLAASESTGPASDMPVNLVRYAVQFATLEQLKTIFMNQSEGGE